MEKSKWEIKKRKVIGDRAFLEKYTNTTPIDYNKYKKSQIIVAILFLVVSIFLASAAIVNKNILFTVCSILYFLIFCINIANIIIYKNKISKDEINKIRWREELNALDDDKTEIV